VGILVKQKGLLNKQALFLPDFYLLYNN